VSYFTEIIPVFPGAIGASGFLAVVQPQEVPTFVTIRGDLLVFLNSKVKVSSAPYVIPFLSISVALKVTGGLVFFFFSAFTS
jgi:hypothetical protein